jgi:hypothetical protein
VFIHCSPGGPDAFDFAVDPRRPPASAHYDRAVTKFLAKIVAWITAGYPEGVPGPDRVPLFALLKPRLTDDEVKAVAKKLLERGEYDDHPDHRRIARPGGHRASAKPLGRQGMAAG